MWNKISDETIIQNYKEKHPYIKIKSIPQHLNLERTGECYCSVCKGTFYKNRGQMLSYSGCPICQGYEVQQGINDIETTAPWMVPYFVDTNFAKTHTANSGKKTKVKCPICGYIKSSEASPNQLYRQGFSCPKCSDNITFPNKMAIELLKQLPIENWDREWRPEWSQGKIYDNYFEYNNDKYILEMDGHFHYEAWRGQGGRSLEENQKIDNLKDILAQKHNIKIIRIDCKESKFNYIKENILKSELSSVFDLTQIDWEIIANNVNKNLVKEICNYYVQNPTKTLQQIGDIFHVSNWTVKRYLERGTECGFCKYTAKFHKKRKTNKTNKNNNSVQKNKSTIQKHYNIYAYDEYKNLIGTYNSVAECTRQLNLLYPDKNFKDNKISGILNGHGYTHRGFSFDRKEINSVDQRI